MSPYQLFTASHDVASKVYPLVKELLRTNDAVFLSWLRAILGAEGIEIVVLDAHMSVLEGSAGAIPRRVMVEDSGYRRARNLLEEAGEGHRLD